MKVTLTEKLFLAEDRKTVVKEGDKRAAFLLGIPGKVLTEKEAAFYGIGAGVVPSGEIQTQVPEVTTQDPQVTNRDPALTAPRRGRPPKSLAG
jgi:hypothetical protein